MAAIEQMELSTEEYISSNEFTADYNSITGIEILPEELLTVIFGYLPLSSILTCAKVCLRWRMLVRDVMVWRHIPIVYTGRPKHDCRNIQILKIINTYKDFITNLSINYINSYTQIKSILDQCNNLISIELVMCTINKDFEQQINRWTSLKEISLKNSLIMPTSDDLLIYYDNFKKLKYLVLSDFGLSSTNCHTLLNCHCLSYIYIEKIKGLNVEFIEQLIISKKNILQCFHIYGDTSVNNKCLYLLSQCPQLTDLSIIRCHNLTDLGLIALSNLMQIEHLQLWNNDIFSEYNLLTMLKSPNMKNLTSLSLSRVSNVSPAVVDVISGSLKKLKYLTLYQCPKIINTDYEKQLKSKFRNIDVVLY